MSSPQVFGVYTAQFPFLDTTEIKIRPVIVLSLPKGDYGVIAVVPVSAKAKAEDVDAALSDWKQTNLMKPSVARVHRLTTMLQADLLTELGALSRNDTHALKAALRKFLQL